MDLLRNAKWRVLDSWTTGVTTHVSNILDAKDYQGEDVTFVLSVPQTTSNVAFSIQGAATTLTADFQALTFNSTALATASTVTGGLHIIHINHNVYRSLRSVTNSTGITSQGLVTAIITNVRSMPTTSASTEVLAQFNCVSPTT